MEQGTAEARVACAILGHSFKILPQADEAVIETECERCGKIVRITTAEIINGEFVNRALRDVMRDYDHARKEW